MSLIKDLMVIAEKEGFLSVKEFVEDFISKKTFVELKEYLEKKHRRYYSTSHIGSTLRPLVAEFGKRLKRKFKEVDQQKLNCGFGTRRGEEIWVERAKRLGFDNLEDFFESNNIKWSDIDRRFGTSLGATADRRRRYLKARDKEHLNNYGKLIGSDEE